MKRATVRYNKDRFDLVVTGRYTVVAGDTASGKTRLSEACTRLFETPRIGRVEGNFHTIGTLSQLHWDDVLESDVEVVIIDEDILLSADTMGRALRATQTYKHHYIVMARSRLEELFFGVDDVFELEEVTSHHFKMVPSSLHQSITRAGTDVPRRVLCEDKRSGFYAAVKVYENSDVSVGHADGKSNLSKYVPDGWYVAADLCGLGGEAIKLAAMLKRHSNTQFCDIVSFEAEALKAQEQDLTIEENFIEKVEQEYADRLDAFLKRRHERGYSKTDKTIAEALITGFDVHTKTKIQGYRLVPGWWVPGVQSSQANPIADELLLMAKEISDSVTYGKVVALLARYPEVQDKAALARKAPVLLSELFK